MKKLLLLFAVLLLILSSSAQIRGIVKDIQNQPVAGATVQLLQLPDSSLVQTLAANANGRFECNLAGYGTYIIRITAVGHQQLLGAPLTLDARHKTLVLPVIVLMPLKPAGMTAVTVTARKPLLEHDLDKTIVNVEAMISAATSNVLEVLGKTPGVTVGADDAISLYGQSGVLVLIDGRPTYMSGQDLANYLKSLPGSMLDKLELMTNPPAKYDANGSSIINIRLKRNSRRGYFGSLALGYNQGRTGRSNNNLMLNYNRGKLNFFGNISFNKDANRTDDRYHRHLPQSSLYLHTITNTSSYSFPLRVGMDYSITPKTTVGLIVQQNERHSDDEWHYNTEVLGKPDSTLHGNTHSGGTWQQRSVNLNAQHNFKKTGHELLADLNYIQYENDSRQNILAGTRFVYVLPSFMKIYNAKVDYSLPVKPGFGVSAGAKWSWVRNDSRNDYYSVFNTTWHPDYGRSNHFVYDERIYAAYLNTRKDWKRFGLQMGLRTEHTNVTGHQLGNAVVTESQFSNHYTSIFPTFFFSYKLDTVGKHSFSASYSRRLNRPGYNQLNPFLFFRDQYTYTTGNPYLGPTFQSNHQLNYRYKQWLSIMAQYNTLQQQVMDVTRAEGNTFITRPENLSGGRMIALLVNINWSPSKWLRTNFNAGVANFKNKALLNNEFIERTRYACRFDGMAQFTFGKGWNAELYGQYMSPMINWQRTLAARYRVNAGLQKKVLKGKGSLKLSVDDMFYWWKDDMQFIGIKETTASQVVRQDMRRAGLAFNYNFGKECFARKRKHSDNAADDVKGRVE